MNKTATGKATKMTTYKVIIEDLENSFTHKPLIFTNKHKAKMKAKNWTMKGDGFHYVAKVHQMPIKKTMSK